MTIQKTSPTARLPLEHRATPFVRLVSAWSRRQYGAVLEPGLAMLHNRKVLRSVMRFEMSVEKWSSLDAELKDLACAAVAAQIGCSWCMDFGYYIARNRGMDPAKLEHLADWRTADVHTSLERDVLAYAEAMTATPPEVTDELTEALRRQLSDEQLVELTAMISLENLRSRTNSALGLTSQGFKDHCEVPRP
ncbi:MAG TPA: carboxymuconolactone decarboxylase family protein [Humibacillus sp.]|nr:carboxymuconolactone decarboxylase family protein [Humibacillus sp.]